MPSSTDQQLKLSKWLPVIHSPITNCSP